MGRFHRHDGEDGHSHSHTHEHSHEHPHSHHHEHDHEHEHGHNHDHDHDHEHPHSREELGDHSKYETGTERIDVLEDIFAENDRKAAHNREAFDTHGIRCINLMSAPGSGKTTLLAATLAALPKNIRVGIVEGDIETSLDADRLAGFGAQISLLNTGNGFGGECHLDAPMVNHALAGLNLSELDLVLIENVGNLVCPAEFAVGEHAKAMVYAVTEGEDKPKKYPVMFRSVDAVIVNKIDLLEYLDFDLELFRQNLRDVNPNAIVIECAAHPAAKAKIHGNGGKIEPIGIDPWINWLTAQTALAKKQHPQTETTSK
ncbi:hydrogenase nickel incorporation protein HypB [Arcanobacterium hippocoleae]